MTFSIVGRCHQTGQVGVALATGLPAAGSHCVYAAGRVGAVATQGYTNPYLGPDVLAALRKGSPAHDALSTAIANDPDAARRQVVAIDTDGRTAAHSGQGTFPWHGHICGDGVAAASNMVPSGQVVEAMVVCFQASTSDALWWRLARALAAGEQAEQQRLRPCRSAVVRVVSTEDYPLLEARVDAADRPIAELLDVVATVERDGLGFTRMMPTRSNLLGAFDPDHLDRRGFMPAPGETPEEGHAL